MSRKLSFSVDDEANEVVKRYEQFLAGSSAGYFDIEEMESIVEYYLRRGRTKDSSKALELGLQLHPNSNTLKIKRGKIYLAVGDINKALQTLNSLSENTEYEALILKTEVLLRLGRSKEAFALALSILENETEELDNICLDLAYIYLGQIDFEKAIYFLEKGDKFFDKNIDLLFELAFCYEQSVASQKAIETYNRIIDIDSYSPEAWFNLGQVYFAEQNFTKALEAYEFSLTIDETDALTVLQKGHAHFQLDQFEQAIEAYLEYEKLVEDKWQAQLFIAECYENMERYEESILHYTQSLEAHPDNFDALTGIGICLLEKEEYAESMEFVQRALAINNEAPDAWVYLAEGLMGMNQISDSLAAYLKSLELEPNQPDTLMAVGNILLENGDFQNALKYYLAVEAQDSTLELLNLFIAVAYYKTDDVIQTLVYLRKAELDNENASVLFLELCPEATNIV